MDVRWGAQPYEGFLSAVCETFGCTPREAAEENPREVQAIMDYRAAAAAARMFNHTGEGNAFANAPELEAFLDELQRAQNDGG